MLPVHLREQFPVRRHARQTCSHALHSEVCFFGGWLFLELLQKKSKRMDNSEGNKKNKTLSKTYLSYIAFQIFDYFSTLKLPHLWYLFIFCLRFLQLCLQFFHRPPFVFLALPEPRLVALLQVSRQHAAVVILTTGNGKQIQL